MDQNIAAHEITQKLTCAECGREIQYGGDLIMTEKGVSGPRGIVPLGEVLKFCSDVCVGTYYDKSDTSTLPKLPSRIP